MRTVQGFALIVLLCVGGSAADSSVAQSYPTRLVRIHAAGVGGTSDNVARVVASEITGPLGQGVVVENYAGNVLVPEAAKLAPDGYTLLITGNNLWISPLFQKMTYDPIRDFAPIAPLTRQSTILVVHPSLPVKTVADLIKLAKAKPGELNYSSGTTGASSHIAAEIFKSMASVNIMRIVYSATPQEMAELLAGQVQVTFGNGPSMGPLVRAGKLRALATAGTGRSILFPDLPTVGETLPGYRSEQLVAFFAPAKVPEAIINRMNQLAVRALEKPEVRDRLLKNGLEPAGGTAGDLAAAIKSEMAVVSKMIKDVGIKTGD